MNAYYGFIFVCLGITGTLRQDAIDRFNQPGAEQMCFLLSTRYPTLPPRYRIRIHDFYIPNPGSYALGSVNFFLMPDK